MKIIRTIETFLPYVCGPANQAFQISNRLELLGFASPVLTTYCDIAPDLPSQEMIDQVQVIRFQNQFKLMRYCISLGMAMHLKNFDILHAHNYRNFQSDLACFFSSLRKKPFILSTHGSLLGYKKYLPQGLAQAPYKIYDKLTFKSAALNANAIVVSSELERNEAIEFGIDLNKIHVIPMGIDLLADSLKEKRIKDDLLRLLFVGRLARVRRVELLLQALSFIKFPVCATIVGGEEETASVAKGGYLSELKKLVKDLKIENKVEFVGLKTKEEVQSYYCSADIFVYPSLYENFGQPILEASAAGLPVISTNVGVAREIIIDSETGFIVSSEPKEIAARICDLMDRETRKKIGDKMRENVAANFGWDMIMKKYLKLYSSF